jgi:hypothetical protein
MENSNSLLAVRIKVMKGAEVWEKGCKVPYYLRCTPKNYPLTRRTPEFPAFNLWAWSW